MSSKYPSPVMYEYLMKARAGHAEALIELEAITADRDRWKELYEKAVSNDNGPKKNI